MLISNLYGIAFDAVAVFGLDLDFLNLNWSVYCLLQGLFTIE